MCRSESFPFSYACFPQFFTVRSEECVLHPALHCALQAPQQGAWGPRVKESASELGGRAGWARSERQGGGRSSAWGLAALGSLTRVCVRLHHALGVSLLQVK